MSNGTLYQVQQIPLDDERLEDADSKLAPFEMYAEFDYFTVLYLDGTAYASFSLTEREDYFPLRVGMRCYMPKKKRKRVLIVNEAQAGKKLILFLGYQGRSEVIR